MAARKTVKLDVFSDFSCGWCYFGHRELEQGLALAQAADLPADFKVQYHPYILHPTLPVDAISRKATLEAKLGQEKWAAICGMIMRRAEQEGVTFTPDSPLSNTLRAHRLAQHAWAVGGQDAQQAVIKAILCATFEENKDIGDVNVLASIALGVSSPTNGKEVSFPPLFEDENSARSWLLSSALEAEIRNLSASAAARGVSGVPCTVVNGRWVLAGCLAPQCYFKVFEKIATGHCSGTCPNLQNGTDNKAGTTCSKAPTVLKADAGTMCGLTGSPETICTPSSEQVEVKKTTKGEIEMVSPPSLHSAAPTAVAI